SQKEEAAGGLDTVADVLRQTSQQLRDRGQANVAPCVDALAEMSEGFSGYLRERDLEDLVGEVEEFARHQPALFFGSAFALGFLAARFLKSSNEPSNIVRYDEANRYAGAGAYRSGSVSGQDGGA